MPGSHSATDRWAPLHHRPPETAGDNDPLWNHTVGAWAGDMIALIALGVICGFFVARFLRRHEPEVMRK